MLPRTNTIQLTHAIAAVAGVGVLICVSLLTALNYVEFPAPFFWLDVAAVYFLAALPLSSYLATQLLQPRLSPSFNFLALELAILFLIPAFYIHARTQSDIARLIELTRQSRFGEADQVGHRIIQLMPRATWNGKPLGDFSTSLDETVARLEKTAAQPLADDANYQERLARAEALAMLGRTDQALAVLDAFNALAEDAAACNLRGTIFETRRQWRLARDWYATATTTWQMATDSPEKTAGLMRAIMGVAFCERKLGRLREAEIAWREFLALAPTADSHFLLAQFYEDTQQTAKSRLHAREAMNLDPDRYHGPGQRLLNNLVTSHFGCLGVFQPSETLTR